MSTSTRVPDSNPVKLRPASAHFTRKQPVPNRGIMLRSYVDPNGTIAVIVTRTGGTADRFYCKVGATQASVALPATIDLTQPVPGDIFRLNQDHPTETFQDLAVPVTGIPPTAPRSSDPPNQWISIGAYDESGNAATILDDDTFAFYAIPSTSTALVSGKGCLFLAYTDPAAPLPGLGLSLPTNRPTSLVAPFDGSNLSVRVPKIGGVNQTWTNHNKVIGPSGEVGDPDLTPPVLLSVTLSSDGMTPQTTPVQHILDGLLAGMWDFGAANRGTPPAGVELAIGVGLDDGTNSANLTLPSLPGFPKPDNLLLGLHTDKWSGTTGGNLTLKLNWS